MNIGHAVTRNAVLRPDSVAVFDPDGDLTYAELDARSNRFARASLAVPGVSVGDRVALFVPNRREVIEVMVGCAKAGLVYVGLNFRLDGNELRMVLENARPILIVASTDFDQVMRPLADELGIGYLLVDGDGPDAYETVMASVSDTPVGTRWSVMDDDDFCIVYSSGTTGVPKGILFDHAAATQHAMIAALEYEIDRDSKYLIQLPHNSSVNITIVPCLYVGAAIGFQESRGFDAMDFAERVRSEAVTHSFLVPTMLYRLLEQVTDPSHLSSMRTLGYGSSSIPPDRVRQLVERFGSIFVQLYGMAEIASIGTLLRKEDHEAALGGMTEVYGSAGRQSYGIAVRVVDTMTGKDVETGQRGEVIFAGPHVMKAYYRDPARTADTLVDGWVHSGDVGVLDANGYLFIVDRIKDLIIRGGHNIAPREIEEVLYGHPAVLEAAVVGLPDDEWGESLCAAVVIRAGHSVGPAELLQWCRDQGLASIKIPAQVRLIDELPKNQVGKIDKKAIVRSVVEAAR